MNDPGNYRDTPLRSYVLTGGRAGPADDRIGVDTLLAAVPASGPLPLKSTPQLRALLRLCGDGALSVAEAAARLGLPAGVVRILAGDLVSSGHLRVHAGMSAHPGLGLLREVLDGLRDL